jgi:alpha-mannosidase
LKVPVAVQGKLIAQTAFGTEELFTDARENVSQRFVAIDTGDKCLGILNQDVYGNHYENSAIYMSLVRGITYCAHPIMDRPLMPEGRFTKKVDQGENRFSFRLTVSDRAQLERKAQEFTMKPFALNIFPVPSNTTGIGEFNVELGDGITTLAAMKKADGKEAILLRLLNNSPDSLTSHVKINGSEKPLSFGKYEVKTIVYEHGVLSESYELLI